MDIQYTKDEYNKEILINTITNEQVMMEWEKPYMNKCIDYIQPCGDVLEIGFGLGYSARKICSYPIKSYTVIECEPVVWEKIDLFKQEYPTITINVIKGRWENKLKDVTKFDTIFFDDFAYEHYESLYPYPKEKRIQYFIYTCLLNHTNIGAKIGYYLSFKSSFDYLNFVDCELHTFTLDIPSNCNYKKDNNIRYIPIIHKIKEPDNTFEEKYIKPFN